MAKLTKAQRDLLERSARRSLADYSGEGASILDGIQARVYERLSALGLVTISAAGLRARITPAGRAALSQEGE